MCGFATLAGLRYAATGLHYIYDYVERLYNVGRLQRSVSRQAVSEANSLWSTAQTSAAK